MRLFSWVLYFACMVLCSYGFSGATRGNISSYNFSKISPGNNFQCILLKSSRKDDLGDKINKLRKARERGKSYDAVIGDGKALSKKVQKLGENVDPEAKKIEDALVESKVAKGTMEVVSQLTSGLRSIVPEDKAVDFIAENEQAMDLVGTLLSNAEDSFREGFEPEPLDSEWQVTSSVGGAWSQPNEESGSMRKPAVSTWGVFERPSDISRAYGGGRDPRLGQRSEEEKRAKEEYTNRLLEEFKWGTGGDKLAEAESENASKISEAISLAKTSIRFGDTYGAVATLEDISKICSFRGAMGGQVWLELGMALECVGDRTRALEIYKKLSKMGSGEWRKNARQLIYGIEAMDMLKLSNLKENEFQKMWNITPEMMRTNTDRRYDTTYIERDADGKGSKSKVFNVLEARDTLREAAKRGGKGISNVRVEQALSFIYDRWQEAVSAARRAAVAAHDEQSIQLRIQSEVRGMSLEGAGLLSLVGNSSTLKNRLQSDWILTIQIQYGEKGVKYLKKGKNSMNFRGGNKAVGQESITFFARSERQGSWEFNSNTQCISLSWDPSWVPNISKGGSSKVEYELLCLQEDALIVCDTSRGTSATITYWTKNQ